eukprot:COSAG04_NODE_11337_length_715_cov_1.331169_1_plen_232_part_10
MSSHDYVGAIDAYDLALSLDVNDSSLSAKYQLRTDEATAHWHKAAARARERLDAAERCMRFNNWETAIDTLRAGLSIEGTADESLMSSLRACLESAEFSKRDRDTARVDAECHLSDGRAAVRAGLYDSAISSLEAGLSLDVQDEELSGRLAASLSSAQSGHAAQESARDEAASHASTGEACMSSHDYVGAIDAYELASAVDVNDAALTAKYQSCVEAARSSLSDAVSAARSK